MIVTVWILILNFGGLHNGGNVTLMPDIATKEDCLRLGNEALTVKDGYDNGVTAARCVPVKKYFPVIEARK